MWLASSLAMLSRAEGGDEAFGFRNLSKVTTDPVRLVYHYDVSFDCAYMLQVLPPHACIPPTKNYARSAKHELHVAGLHNGRQ